MNNNDSQLVIHDRPIALWIFGLVFAGVGSFFCLQRGSPVAFFLIFVVVGLLILLFSSALTVTADRLTQMLSLDYRSILRHDLKQIPFREIAGINVENSRSRSRGRSQTTYRVVIKRNDGQLIPLRSYYSSGAGGKEQQADRLRGFIGVQGFDATPAALLREVPQIAQASFQARQEALTGPEAEVHETGGIHWQIQSGAMGASPVTRWFSPDFKTPGMFVFIAQKVDGQGSGGGLMALIGDTLFKQSISLYGFRPDDTPCLEQAGALAPLDPALEPHFMAFTNDPAAARQVLNPWVVMPLGEWGRRYPLRQLQVGGRFGQLVVLFGPNGVFLATLNLLQPDQVQELSALGVDLVKASGGSSTGGSASAF